MMYEQEGHEETDLIHLEAQQQDSEHNGMEQMLFISSSFRDVSLKC